MNVILKELVMLLAVIVLMGAALIIVYWFGERQGINKERKNILGIINSIPVKSFAVDTQYGASVVIGHICDLLREEK